MNYSDEKESKTFEQASGAKPVISNGRSKYRQGYEDGRYQQDIQRSNNSSGSFLAGILLTLLIGLSAGTVLYFYFDQQNRESTVKDSAVEPPPPNKETNIIERTIVQPAPQNKETNIIERTIERTQEVVPVPVTPESSSPNQEAQPEEPPASDSEANSSPVPAESP